MTWMILIAVVLAGAMLFLAGFFAGIWLIYQIETGTERAREGKPPTRADRWLDWIAGWIVKILNRFACPAHAIPE